MAQRAPEKPKCACGCGAELVQPERGRRRRFATEACRAAAYRARGWGRELGVPLAEAERLAGRRRGTR